MKATLQAKKILHNLKKKAIKNPSIFCENYGQQEIINFKDRLDKMNISYKEQCEALNILEQISDFSPYQ